MEINPNFAQFEEPAAARLREQFVEFIATVPDPSEMTDEQLSTVGEVLAQMSVDVVAAVELIDAEERRREASSNKRGSTAGKDIDE